MQELGPTARARPAGRWWRLARHVAGWVVLGLGIAGLILPILPGWLLIGWGAIILAADVPLFARCIQRIENRFPALRRVTEKMGRRPD